MSSVKVMLCRLHELADGAARKFDVAGRALAVVRIGNDVYAIGDRCSHANISLSEGDVHVAERELECWKHGSTFSLTTGVPSSLPATRPVPVYEVTVVDGDVMVELS